MTIEEKVSSFQPALVARYLNPAETLVNMALREDPTEYTAVTMAMESPPAMMAYSMAVVPASLRKNVRRSCATLCCLSGQAENQSTGLL
jgi:hypothetical protein